MSEKLDPNKIHSWTNEECVVVYASLNYLGGGEWSSPLLSDYLDEEEVNTLNGQLAQAYVEDILQQFPELKGKQNGPPTDF